MTLAADRKTAGRQPISVVEMDLDTCSLTYSVLPCTANNGAGNECYNTRKTCQDVPNYTKTTKTYRFCSNLAALPIALDAIPCVQSVSLAPTSITLGKGLGPRASVTVTFKDFPHHDRGIDPYVANRNYVAAAQGTFFGKLKARTPYYQNRTLRIMTGYIVDGAVDFANFDTRTYVLSGWSGPDNNGTVRITGKDILKLADDKKSRIPAVSSGALAADMLGNDTTLTLTTGTAASYGTAGKIRIGDEIMSFAAVSGDTLSGLVRGLHGTTAGTHSIDDSVQICQDYSGWNVVDTIKHALINFTGINPLFIPTAAWQTERDRWLSLFVLGLNAIISEPMGVLAFINDLVKQSLLNIWWDERAQQIKLQALAVAATTPINDEIHLLNSKTTIKDVEKDRLSQVWYRYGLKNATKPNDKAQYASIKVQADLTAEGEDQYGESQILDIKSRWYDAAGIAIAFASRMLIIRRDTPVDAEFTLDAKDSDLWTGDSIGLKSRIAQGADGAAKSLSLLISAARETKTGDQYQYRATSAPFSGRYAQIMPALSADYSGAEAGAWIAPTAAGFSDGKEAFKIL